MISARNREVSYRKALRKRRIAKEIYSYGNYTFEYYDNLHQYSKNKIHCSCAACQQKTRNKGKRHARDYGWYPSINYKISDLRKLDKLNYIDEEMEVNTHGNN